LIKFGKLVDLLVSPVIGEKALGFFPNVCSLWICIQKLFFFVSAGHTHMMDYPDFFKVCGHLS
jgi:hypothetical protein